MGLYARFVLPRLIDLAMRDKEAARLRAKIIPGAKGAVLEIGIGSGLNLPFYTDAVTHLYGVDPSPQLLQMARPKVDRVPFPVEFLNQSAERLSLADHAVDSAVVTWSLCSIPDAGAALREVKRVLKPDGRLIFVEHGLAPDPGVQAWQNRLNPLWRRLAGGCNLIRKMDNLIETAGFSIRELHQDYLPGPRPMTYTYEGFAEPDSGPAPPAHAGLEGS
jgi:ubiquinone/menaquinone biosynthesis C-methylase UbiE